MNPDQAVAVFGDTDEPAAGSPNPKSASTIEPPSTCSAPMGGHLVEEMLGQIDEGMFA